MKQDHQNKFALCAVAAGILWGTLGLFTRRLTVLGMNTWSIVAMRSLIAALCFFIAAMVKDRSLLRFRLRDIWCFLGAGVFSLLAFYYCYFSAIERMALSTAGILLYTAPAFVMVMSRVFFREKVGVRGVIALVLCFAGILLVSGTGGSVSRAGFLFGLGSGIGYALFSIFSRCAMNRGYGPLTINFWASLFCCVGGLCFSGVSASFGSMTASGTALLLCLGLGILVTFLPYYLYTFSLTGIPNGYASIMASVEPVVATILSVAVYREILPATGYLGIVLVLAAIVLLNLGGKKTAGS